MPNNKRKVSANDYLDCYLYFQRAIQNDRFLQDNKYDDARVEAINAFAHITANSIDESSIKIFQLWLDNFIDAPTWACCYRALNQKKYLKKNEHRTISINEETYIKLKSFANEQALGISQAIGQLLLNNMQNTNAIIEPNNNDLQPTTQSAVVITIPENPLPKINAETYHKVNNVIPLHGEELPISNDETITESEEDLFDWFDDPVWPSKPENYDFRQNESYKAYRQRIKKLTIKDEDDSLLNYFYKRINYYLTEDNCKSIGTDLLAMRQELLDNNLFTTTFNPDDFVISKPLKINNRLMNAYGDDLIYYLQDIFGCCAPDITAGNSRPTVFAGHCTHVQIVYKTFNYLDAFLSDEVEKYAENCHKNTKRKNRLSRADNHGNSLVDKMLDEILGDYDEHKLFSEQESEKLIKCSDKIHIYYDENEPIGGWFDPKNPSCW